MRIHILFSMILAAAFTATACIHDITPPPAVNDFTNPRQVTITGYADHAMEPFISRDGLYLFFNNLNDGADTSLHWALRVDDVTFQYQGRIAGVNGTPPHLDAVASMDRDGRFYFTTVRSYFTDGRTIYTGAFLDGTVTGPAVQTGDFYRYEPGWLVMDVEVSPDGQDMYYSEAHFSGGPVPDASDILLAHRVGDAFTKDSSAATIMAGVNTPGGLEYAPSISADGLELFFTRLDWGVGYPRIYRTTRPSLTAAFGDPVLIAAITGFAEAPSITSDGKNLYYHAKSGTLHVVMMVTRP